MALRTAPLAYWRGARNRLALQVALCAGLFAPAPATLGCQGAQEKAPPPQLPEPEPVDTAPELDCPDEQTTVACAGYWAAHCEKGELTEMVNCRESSEVCAPELGCRTCVPGERSCGGSNNLIECQRDGSEFELVERCDESRGEHCSLTSGTCEDLCQAAEDANSYIGCAYWAVPTINSRLALPLEGLELCRDFTFAVVVANPQAVTAEITISRRQGVVRRVSVDPGEVRDIGLDWIPELSGLPLQEQLSAKVPDGAYHIQSSVPVTVYQFNPLEYREACGEDWAYTHTNDASLLLPTHTLTGNYLVMSRPTMFNLSIPDASDCGDSGQPPCGQEEWSSTPGFVAVVGVEDAPVEVELTVSSHTSPDPEGTIPALEPGDTHRVTLERGEVLQLVSAAPLGCRSGSPSDEVMDIDCFEDEDTGELECLPVSATFHYCKVGDSYDLTGTRIAASGKVAVVAGHDCAFVPHNRWACDHLEESMFPLEAWGKEVFVSVSEPLRKEPNLMRVMSGADGNTVAFSPEVRDEVSLDSGEFIEFEAHEHLRVRGDKPLMVAQFLVGQDYAGYADSGPDGMGDPGMSLGIPVEQWRKQYAFLAPGTFSRNYVNVIAGQDALILLDGEPVGDWQPIEGTPMASSRVEIDGGQHTVEAMRPFGIVVYGYARYTSYIYPGGLDLRQINIL